MSLSLSVVVRCLNEEQHIGRLLTGILKQALRPQQIIVVDSGSTDATLAIAARFAAEIHTIEPASFSFGRSLNVGCRAATGDVIVLASAHVYPVYDSWLTNLVAPFDDPRVALAYGRQVADETTRYSERQIMRSWFPERSDFNQGHPFCNNANAAIRRSIWQELPYDEELTGLEDVAWAHEALGRGHRVAYVADAPVAHVHRESWSQIVSRYRREAIAHRRIMHDRGVGRIEAIRLAVANVASDYWHALRDGELRRNLLSIPWFRAAQFRGTFAGFAQRGEVSAVLRRRFYYPLEARAPRIAADRLSGGGRLIQYEEPPNEPIGGKLR